MTDIVILWVDGDEPGLRAKRESYMARNGIKTVSDDINGSTRYSDKGEIYFCIGSILRFTDFVRKIFIVTDNQRPTRLEEFLSLNFPGNKVPIEIVDHKILFRGYEQYLPTFNCNSIETMMYRIPGLGEDFVYFNDDVFLTSRIREEDWFTADGKAVCYARRFGSAAARLLKWLKPKKDGHKPIGHKDVMLNSADIAASRYFWYFPHVPLAVCRSWYEDFYKEHPDIIIRNIKDRFRSPVQFNPQQLFYIYGEKQGRCVIKSPKGRSVFFKPENGKGDGRYMMKKIAEADSGEGLLFGCISSMDKGSEKDFAIFNEWACRKIGLDPDFLKRKD